MADELANAARILSRAAERLGSRSSASPQSECSSNENSVASSSTSSSNPSVSNEVSRLFPHHFQRDSSSSNWRPSTSKKRKRTPAAKATKSKLIVRKFVCLSDKDQVETPDSEETRELLLAGLGETKLSVPEEATEIEIREVVMKTFPKLREAGGFEFMYSEPRKRELKVIPPGPSGLTMKFLVSFIGQGKVFVRPIQQDLDCTPPFETTMVQKETCKRCLVTLDVYSLRKHHAICSKINSKYADLFIMHYLIFGEAGRGAKTSDRFFRIKNVCQIFLE